MKTRVIHTKLWKDEYFYNLNDKERLAFMFLLFNENNNMCGIYELNDVEAITWLKTTADSWSSIKAKFEQDTKFMFYGGWVKVINHDKYNNYGKGEKQQPALEKEINLIPKGIMEYFDTSIDTSIHTRHKSKTINHKSKTINHKRENFEKKFSKITDLTKPVLEDIAETYGVPAEFVESKLDDLKNYIGSTGKTYKDYNLTLRGWVKRDKERLVNSNRKNYASGQTAYYRSK